VEELEAQLRSMRDESEGSHLPLPSCVRRDSAARLLPCSALSLCWPDLRLEAGSMRRARSALEEKLLESDREPSSLRGAAGVLCQPRARRRDGRRALCGSARGGLGARRGADRGGRLRRGARSVRGQGFPLRGRGFHGRVGWLRGGQVR
jgi:hypothetical protein